VFNKLYDYMLLHPDHFQAKKAPRMASDDFRITAWNAAWTASDIASRGEKALLKELVQDIRGYDRYEEQDVSEA